MNQAIEGKLTVVCAPAGFGKTTLLGQWLATEPAAAWLSLDQSDNEPTRFWAYFIAALQTVHTQIGQATLCGWVRLSRCRLRCCSAHC